MRSIGVAFLRGVAGLLLLAAPVAAAPLVRDLGQGLVYARVHALPADLPAAPAAGRVPPCVVDLRYVAAEGEAADAFMAWLKFRATPRTPVFVLANSDTSPALRRLLAAHARRSGVLTVGLAGPDFTPDIEVKGAAEAERRAYDALERGAPLAKLLADNPDKARNDEASLSKPLTEPIAEAATDDGPGGKREAPPIDAALQRALHLHRALVALKRL